MKIPISLRKKQTVNEDEVWNLRSSISDKTQELASLADLDSSPEEIQKRISGGVDSLRQAAQPSVYFANFHGQKDGAFGMRELLRKFAQTSELIGPVIFSPEAELTALHLQALIDPEKLKTVLYEAVLANVDQSNMMSESERKQKETALKAEIEQLERQEEALCRQLDEQAGSDFPRRHNASPRWLLAPDKELKAA